MEPSLKSKIDPVCQLQKILAYGSSYVDARADSFKISARKALNSFSADLSLTFLGVMTLLLSLLFLMYGIALGLGYVLGERLWLGFVLTGVVFLLGNIFLSKLMQARQKKSGLKSQIEKYQTELKIQNKTLGVDMGLDSDFSSLQVKNEADFLIWKAALARSAFLEAGKNLKDDLSSAIDIRQLIKDHPFYVAGATAFAGFAVAGSISKPPTYQIDEIRALLEKIVAKKNETESESTLSKSAFVAMLIAVAEEALKESVTPALQDYISSLTSSEADSSEESLSA